MRTSILLKLQYKLGVRINRVYVFRKSEPEGRLFRDGPPLDEEWIMPDIRLDFGSSLERNFLKAVI